MTFQAYAVIEDGTLIPATLRTKRNEAIGAFEELKFSAWRVLKKVKPTLRVEKVEIMTLTINGKRPKASPNTTKGRS